MKEWIDSSKIEIKVCNETEICNIIKDYIKTIENPAPQLELVNFYAKTFELNDIKSSFPWRGAKNSLQIDSFIYEIPLDKENKATIYLYTSKQFFDRYDMFAAAVIVFSQLCLRLGISFLESKNCSVKYTDTDSKFFTIPEELFIEINKLYSHDKKLHAEMMIKKSIEYAKIIEVEINEFLKKEISFLYMR
ncbi:17747_t:CDS:2 [Dentiscutata erythropus]|uniref:17747_t:CDS:1 n=1 Tax=Dentiscutata erythropus TaxID=1348616 RepID=A0A9N9F5A1_9GLOM|nr:17747_t:CDS:2 [Dentiscutata erythropus]